MPPPDKIRPLRSMGCSEDDCEFTSTQEWAWLRHEQETGHLMAWPEPRLWSRAAAFERVIEESLTPEALARLRAAEDAIIFGDPS